MPATELAAVVLKEALDYIDDMTRRTVVIGASPKPDRYSHRAVRLLKEKGHEVIPVNPAYTQIDDLKVAKTLADVAGPVFTVSMYLAPEHQKGLNEDLLALHPERVIFNPGSENPELRSALESGGIKCLEACTLVLLTTNQYGPATV